MKKRLSIPLIVVGSVVAAIIIAALVLSFISIRPFKPFSDYNNVVISTSTNSNIGDITAENRKDIKSAFDKNLKKSGFSVMYAMLQFSYDYKPNFTYELDDKGKPKKDDDNNKIIIQKTYAEVIAETKAAENNYLVEFWYNDIREYKVDETVIKYDRMRMLVATTDGDVNDITFYLYDSNMVDAVNPDAEEYRIYPLTIAANTSPLYLALGTLTEDMAK